MIEDYEAGQVPQRAGSLRRNAHQDTSGAYFLDTYTFTGFGRAAVDLSLIHI